MKQKSDSSGLPKCAFLILIFIVFWQLNSYAQQNAKDTIRVLFVGNSYTYVGNLPQVVSFFAESKKIPLITRKSVKGGIYLKNHWFGQEGLNTKKITQEGRFDFVILQDQCQAPVEVPDTTLKYAKLLCDFIKKSGARPLFYETWARDKIQQQQEGLSAIYAKAAFENNAKVIPVGHAWELARKLRPTVPLFAADGSHSSSLGVYLNACMFFTALTGENPAKLPNDIFITDKDGESLSLLNVDKEDAVFVQRLQNRL